MKKLVARALSVGTAASLAFALVGVTTGPANAAIATNPETPVYQSSSSAATSAKQQERGVATSSYSATGSIASTVFYAYVNVKVAGGKNFTGNAGGLFSPGGGALFGDIYTADLARLYRDTTRFQVNTFSAYADVNFYDSEWNFLGSFQSGGVSTVVGTGAGTGSWS